MSTIPYIDVDDFSDPEFHKIIKELIAKYVDLRVRAIPQSAAFRRVFGAENCDTSMYVRIQNLEASDAYNDLFEARLKTVPVDELLDAKKALHGYLEIARNPNTKEMAKINALREACVIANITAIDDEGRSRLGGTLADFYQALAGGAAPSVAEPERKTTH